MTLDSHYKVIFACSATETIATQFLDVAKTRAQISANWNLGIRAAVVQSIKQRVIMRGFVVSILQNSILASWKLVSRGYAFTIPRSDQVYYNSAIGGAIGIAEGAVIGPIDRIKILRQTSNLSWEEIGRVGIKGTRLTVLRQGIYGAVFFPVYNSLLNSLKWKDVERFTGYQMFLAASGASLCALIAGSPIDVWKTKVQAIVDSGSPTSFRKLVTEHGFKHCFAGLYLNSVKSIIGIGASLIAYDNLKLI